MIWRMTTTIWITMNEKKRSSENPKIGREHKDLYVKSWWWTKDKFIYLNEAKKILFTLINKELTKIWIQFDTRGNTRLLYF